MIVSIIVAAAENGAIGKDNDLLWRFPNDTQFFKETTLGHHVIMGRKNFESIPHKYRPLPNRVNIIVTRQDNYTAEECTVVNSIESALELAKKNGESEAFIIGGGQIYQLALANNLVDKIYLTRIHSKYEGDTFFKKLNSKWIEKSRNKCTADEKHPYDYSFITLEKN